MIAGSDSTASSAAAAKLASVSGIKSCWTSFARSNRPFPFPFPSLPTPSCRGGGVHEEARIAAGSPDQPVLLRLP